MLNNPALDIAIGLVFIYGLYGLLVTTLTELVSSILQQRGRTLRQGIIRMLDSDEISDVKENFSEAFFNRPEIKYLGNKYGKNKNRLPSYIKPKTFSRTLLNILGFVYSSDANLSQLKEKLNPGNETHQLLINLIEEANNSVEKFKVLVEEWFNETMDRVEGWYKRKAYMITFIVGLVLSFGLNINTIEISKRLGTDENIRLAMVEAASNSILIDSVKVKKREVNELLSDVEKIVKESSQTASIFEINYPFCNNEPDKPTWWSYIFGCLITGVALSLGAPFWFDLLNRLVKLRTSGTREDNESSNKDNTNAKNISG